MIQFVPFEITVRRIESRISMIENRIERLLNPKKTGGFKAEFKRIISANAGNNGTARIEEKNAYSGKSSDCLGNIAGSGEENMISGIECAHDTGRILQLIDQLCSEMGVDPDLVKAMVKIESNFNPGATSRCGAMGLMQLMPETAKGLGVDNAYDIFENLNGGIKMIKRLIDSFDQNIKFALAAYNAGPGRVIEYGGIPPIQETKDYVYKILSIYDPALL